MASSRWRFHAYTFLGSWVWCLALAYIGMQLGEHWDSDPRLKAWMHRFDLVILAAMMLALGAFLRRRVRHRSA